MNPASPFLEETTSLCPQCLAQIPAQLREEPDGTVSLYASCPAHGEFQALLASDSQLYARLRQSVAGHTSGCCGMGESCDPDSAPVCVLLLEITLACNLRCPACYADAQGHDFMALEEVTRRLDLFFSRNQRLDLLMLSGGEPTIHPQFDRILEIALSYPIERILINTNGLRLLHEGGPMDAIAAHRDRVELFLSFSSFRPQVHERLYGKDLREQKEAAVALACEKRVFTTLVPTIERGVNDDEIGALYRFALQSPYVNGLNFQPVMSAGRYENGYDAGRRMTLTDVILELERQTEGALFASDFVALPCSHPDCCALTYGFLDADRKTIQPLPRHLDVGRYVDMFADRISFSGMVGSAARRVWSDAVHLRAGKTLADLTTLFKQGGITGILPLLGNPEEVGKRIMRIVIKPFMDAHTFDTARTQRCCTRILLESGEAMSFCQYNVLYRGRKPRQATIPLTPAMGKAGLEDAR